MKIAVGCPVFERAWCLPQWFESVEAQTARSSYEFEFHFVYTPGDDETLSLIQDAPGDTFIVVDAAPGFTNEQRADSARYAHLAMLRNKLLDSVRRFDYDAFLSWDCDVLLNPDGVDAMLGVYKPVTGALIEMMGQDWLLDGFGEAAHASWMNLDTEARTAIRPKDGVIRPGDHPRKVGVVMAVVLFEGYMLPQIRYDYHPQGEDIALALHLASLGIERWIAPDARGVHLHDKPALAESEGPNPASAATVGESDSASSGR